MDTFILEAGDLNMGSVNDMLKEISIPKLVKVRQVFDKTCLADVGDATRRELQRAAIEERIRPGMSIAITAGSRGIDNLAVIIREIASFIKEKGAFPFVIPAMGSHGGSTAPGQAAVLREYHVTEDYIGCPVRATMETTQIGTMKDDGAPILIDRYAAAADGIVVVNRIKPHTAFRGLYESGLMKMMTIGLGKQAGAEVCHRAGILNLGKNVERFAFGILENANILFGVGTVENAFDKTAVIKVLTKEEIPVEEPKLLARAKALIGKIKFDQVDVLVVDEIGKNISGEGMDPNIAGRWIVPTIKGGIDAKIVAVLDLTAETLGNSVGLGMADVCSKRAMEKVNTDNTYPNSLTSTVTSLCKIPMYFDNHAYTIKAAIKMAWAVKPENVTLIRIKNTLELEYIYISENLMPAARQVLGLEIVSQPQSVVFDENGDLF
jgi:hypothetical protein